MEETSFEVELILSLELVPIVKRSFGWGRDTTLELASLMRRSRRKKGVDGVRSREHLSW